MIRGKRGKPERALLFSRVSSRKTDTKAIEIFFAPGLNQCLCLKDMTFKIVKFSPRKLT